MQDRYVGDIGDFGKYSLLRSVVRESPGLPSLRLAVNWYRVPNESHNNDGRHTQYLKPQSLQARIRSCEPKLYDALAQVVLEDRRTLEAVQTADILPAGTCFFSEQLCFTGLGFAERASRRTSWIRAALASTRPADVVFLDPDNGLECSVRPLSGKGPKYVFLDDLPPYLDRRQSVIVYHHTSRQGSARQQLEQRFRQIRQALPTGFEVFALRYRRGSSRAYLFLARISHQLRGRAKKFVAGPWQEHFEWIESHGAMDLKEVNAT